MFNGVGKAAGEAIVEKFTEKLKGLGPVLSQLSPVEILRVIFTPDNMRAFGEGLAYGGVKAAMEKKQ